MIQKVIKTWKETVVVYRVRLGCGHMYTRPIPLRKGVLTEYDCPTCDAYKKTSRRTRYTREADERLKNRGI